MKSIFPELVTKLDSSVRVNLANSVVREIPKLKCLGHSPMETAYIRNLDYISTTRPKNCNGLRRSTDRDDRLGYTHDFETMSKTTAYCNHIKNSEIETGEVFEQETSNKNIENIGTQLDKT